MEITEEFEGADLGERSDARLSQRLTAMARDFAANPGESIPKALRAPAAIEAAYRFLNREDIEPSQVLGPHVGMTARRCADAERVIVAHDTTEFGFSTPREGLGRVGDGPEGRAFYCHAALAVSGDGSRDPLGILGAQTFTLKGKSKRKRTRHRHTEKQPEPQRLSSRWPAMLEHANEQLNEGVVAIHVCDREADSYLLYARALREGVRFVIRGRHDRAIEVDGARDRTMKHALKGLSPVFTRSVELAPRKPKVGSKKEGRTAKLEVFSTPVVIRKPSSPPSTRIKLPETIALNLVYVREVDPPSHFAPVEWKLLTTEPIDTAEDVAAIVDAYDTRWVIEEYFKALKTGCAIERRQLESATSIYNALAVFMPIAWMLLRLRRIGSERPEAPATEVLPPLYIKLLQRHRKVKLKDNPTARDAWLAVARLGGHMKQNGPPGWQTVGKGFLDLLILAEGALLAMDAFCDQS